MSVSRDQCHTTDNNKQTWGKIKLLKNLGVCHTDIIMGVYENCEQTYSDEELVPQHTGIS